MLARLTPGFFLLVLSAAIAACSTNATTPSSGGVPGTGPNIPTNSVYVANTSGQAIEIFYPSPMPSSLPNYAIGGSNSGMNGPQFLAFDPKAKTLWVTNYNAPQNTSSIIEFAQWATGNVIPLNSISLSSLIKPRGIAVLPSSAGVVVAESAPGTFFTDAVQVYVGGAALLTIAGNNTTLNVPTGVAVQNANTYFVSNAGNASVTVFVTPSPAPTPSATATPTATPSPTPTPTGATPSPTPVPTSTPTPSSANIAPALTIAGPSTQMQVPMGIALDSAGNLWVADAGQPTPRILEFLAPSGTGVQNMTPAKVITSSALVNPVDVKLDTSGNIYVVDQGAGPSTSKLLIFPAASNGAVTPTIVNLPGNDTGLAISP